jgi:hypothetical protein
MNKNRFFIIVFFFLSMVMVYCGADVVEVEKVEQTITSSGPKTIFYDNFNDRKNEWQQIRGSWKIDSNGFFQQRSADERMLNCILYVDNPQTANATYETFLRIAPDLPTVLTDSDADRALRYNIRYICGAGLIFRMKDQDNFYMFRLAGEEGAVLGKMVNGEWFDIANPRTIDFLPSRVKFSADNWYRLKVDANGDRIVCYINDSVVCSATDSQFSLGRFGLCTFKSVADFDYIKVYDKTESEIR